MVASKEEAKRKYVAKTTGARWDDGVKDGGIGRWAKETGKYYHVTVGPESKKNFKNGVTGKKKVYEKNTDGAAYDRLFKNAAKGLKH